jgi:hypothetical protein
LIIVQGELSSLEKLMGKLMLEEQREVRFGDLSENEVLLVKIENFQNRTINFRGGIGNFKGKKSFPRQDKKNFGKGGANAFNSMNKLGHNN